MMASLQGGPLAQVGRKFLASVLSTERYPTWLFANGQHPLISSVGGLLVALVGLGLQIRYWVLRRSQAVSPAPR